MASPVTPNDFRETLPGPTGSFCEKFLKNILRLFPERVYLLVRYLFNNQGGIGDDFKADLAKLGCFGVCDDGTDGNGDGTSLLAPTNVQASDGAYNDRVRVTWSVVSGANLYEIYRATVSTASSATLIGTSQSETYDDTTGVASTLYYYWVKATNSDNGKTGPISQYDSGYVASILDQVQGIGASQGWYPIVHSSLSASINLWFIPITEATGYDIHRGVTNDFAASTKIVSNRVPHKRTDEYPTLNGNYPLFYQEEGHVVYQDNSDLVSDKKYYYWVVARLSGTFTGIGPPSEVATGWKNGWGDGAGWVGQDYSYSLSEDLAGDTLISIPATMTEAYIVMIGPGGAGAGSGAVHGGGGGGAGGIVWGHMPVTGGGKFKIKLSDWTTRVATISETSGQDSPTMTLEYDATGLFAGAEITLLETDVNATGGEYNPAGDGVGGLGGTIAADASFAVLGNHAGFNGRNARGSIGGRSGWTPGGISNAPSNYGNRPGQNNYQMVAAKGTGWSSSGSTAHPFVQLPTNGTPAGGNGSIVLYMR